MAYTINLTNGAIFAVIPDGTRDTSSSLVIIGKNFAGYGEFIGENFVKVLENHANNAAPDAPLTGQLWYDTSESKLKVYDSAVFKTLGITTSSATEPVNKVDGDMWYDTTESQLKVYNGTTLTYDIVGPLYSSTTDITGPIVESLFDTSNAEHSVTYGYADGQIVSISHRDAPFTINAGTPIAGFAGLIYPGIQLATTVSGEVPQFTGTATNAELLDGIDSTGYLSSLNNDVTAGTLGILNDAGLTVGADSDLQLSIVGDDAYINNSTTNGKVFIQANPSGVTTSVISIISTGTDARARVDTPLAGTDITNMDYVTTASLLLLPRDGSRPMTGDLDAGSNSIINLANPINGTDAINLDSADTRYLQTETSDNVNTAGTSLTRFYSVPGDQITNLSEANNLQVFQPTAATDAMMSFHVGSDFAVHFGLDGTTNDLAVGGWSMGGNSYKIWHEGNDGPTSGLAAQTADFATTAGFANSAAEQFKFPRQVGRSYYTNYYNSRTYGIFVSVQAENINNYRTTLMLRISRSGFSTVDCRAMSWAGNADHRTYGFWYVPAQSFYQLRNEDNSTRVIYQWVEWY